MPDVADLVAREQANVLGGGVHRFPEDNYSLVEMNEVDVLFCARVLSEGASSSSKMSIPVKRLMARP